jgi:glycerophosphoryl diester phosphodiesterase
MGLELHVWTVNEEAEMRSLLALGVDGIITDFPARLLKLLASRPAL